MDVFEAMGTAVTMRWLRPDPVPDELVDKVLWGATRASNPGNSQPWDFVVVRDAAMRAELSELLTGRFRLAAGSAALPDDPTERRMMAGGRYLAEHLAEAPVLIFVCGSNIYPPRAPQEAMMYSAVYAAAQNLLVTARALELGAAFTSLHLAEEDAIKERLGIPAATGIFVTMPLGWPARPFGEMTRKPIEEVVHHERW